MSDFRTKKSFEKAFKQAVPNFDETKIHFDHPSKMYNESKICFVLDGKLKKLPIFKSQYHIDLWKNYFIEYLNTGTFDMHGYWRIYTDKDGQIGPVLKFPLCNEFGNEFYPNSPEMGKYLQDYRLRFNRGYGITQVEKPL